MSGILRFLGVLALVLPGMISPAGAALAQTGTISWSSHGPAGGSVQALAIDPSTPNTLYAGTFGNGVFKSIDGGASWRQANTGLTDLRVRALAVNPKAPNTLYAGTSGGGVFKSTDGSATWQSAGTGLADLYITVLAIDPQSPATLYAGTRWSPVYKSTNSGATWNPTAAAAADAFDLALDPGCA